MTILTSRSRMAAYANCPRLGYLSYDYRGRGLEPVAVSLPLIHGIAVHEALAGILTGHDPLQLSCKIRSGYTELLRSRAIANEDLTGLEFLVNEQLTLLEGTLWAWLRARYPLLKAEYDFVAIERELRWPMTSDIIDQVRCDVLARRKSDGGLFYVEWKTTSTGGDDWVKSWEHNSQLLANVNAIEEVLHERCEGVIIEGLIKGRRAKDRAKTSPFYDRRIQQSPVCYGYKASISGDCQAAYTNAKGWRKIAVWDEMPVRQWVDSVMTTEECAGLFVSVPPIIPNRRHLDRWRRQTIAQERSRADALLIVHEAETDPDQQRLDDALDLLFPQNDDHCNRYWGYPCAFEPLCFRDEVARDPIGSGLYQVRVNHHEQFPEEIAPGTPVAS